MTEPVVNPANAPTVPVWEDCLEIFYAPRAVFERRKAAGFGIPLLIFFVVFLALFYAGRGLMAPIFDAEFDRGIAVAMKQNPQLTPEMAEKGRAFAQGFTAVFIAGFALVGPLLVGILLWFAGKMVGARQQLGAACMVACYAFYPRLLESLVNLLQAGILPAEKLTSRYSVQLGPARFFDPDHQMVLMSILGRFDLITLWCTALLALGLAVTGKIELKKAAIAAGLVWLVPTLLAVWQAARAAG